MKILTVLGVIQIAAILFLYSKIVDIEKYIDRPAAVAQDPSIVGDRMRPNTPDNTLASNPYANEDSLRQIIREELAAQLGDGPGRGTREDSPAAPVAVDPAELESRRERVAQQLEYFSSVGSITDAEMQQLQVDIARLDPASQTEMLRELTRALNSGRLKGQL